jgi:hypothetical protein
MLSCMQHKDRHVQSRAIAALLFEPNMSLSTMAAIMGRAGGLKGGPARAEALSPKRRSEIASMAAKKRWNASK